MTLGRGHYRVSQGTVSDSDGALVFDLGLIVRGEYDSPAGKLAVIRAVGGSLAYAKRQCRMAAQERLGEMA